MVSSMVESAGHTLVSVLLDIGDNHGTQFSGKLGHGLEADSAANRGNVGERLENLGVADAVAIVEENRGSQS